MASEKAKAVARAICRVELNGGDPDQAAVRWNGTEMEPQDFPVWKDFIDEANAALDAAAAVDGDAHALCFARLDSILKRLDDRYADKQAGTVIRALIKDAKLEIHDLIKQYWPIDGDAQWNAALEAASKCAESDKDNPTAGKWIAVNIRSLKRG